MQKYLLGLCLTHNCLLVLWAVLLSPPNVPWVKSPLSFPIETTVLATFGRKFLRWC